MPNNVVRAARHRRALRVGIALSAVAHAAALALITVPATTTPAPPGEDASAARPLAALEVVRIADPAPPMPVQRTAAAPATAAPRAAKAIAPSEAGAAAPAELDVLLAELTSASPIADRTDTSRPISASKRLKAVGGTSVGSAVALSGASEEEGERSLWGKLLDGVTISVGAGPYCPVRGGPLILR